MKLASRKRKEWVRRTYGLEWEDYEGMLWLQDNKCLICSAPDPNHVDHDHATGQVRGILCAKCNKGLGHFDDSQELLLAAAHYLDTSPVVTVISG